MLDRFGRRTEADGEAVGLISLRRVTRSKPTTRARASTIRARLLELTPTAHTISRTTTARASGMWRARGSARRAVAVGLISSRRATRSKPTTRARASTMRARLLELTRTAHTISRTTTARASGMWRARGSARRAVAAD